EAEFDIMYGEGISREGDLLDLGVDKGLVEKSGAWFSYKSDRIGQGRENAKQFLRENKDITARLEIELRRELGLKSLVVEPPAPTPEQKQAASAAHGRSATARK
ncbi:MAG: recombinase RecA, partial [Candidatus Angelobacter sp.]